MKAKWGREQTLGEGQVGEGTDPLVKAKWGRVQAIGDNEGDSEGDGGEPSGHHLL